MIKGILISLGIHILTINYPETAAKSLTTYLLIVKLD